MPRLVNRAALVAIASVSFSAVVEAGESAEKLAKCLVDSTTAEDKATLAQWMFTALSLHPEAVKLSPITSDVRKSVTERAARLMERLITESCVTEARTTAKAEGLGAVSGSLQVLGQVAGRELLSNADVSGGMSAVGGYMDEKKIEAAVIPEGAAGKPGKDDKSEKPAAGE
jgi:hypothetical protein